MERQMGFSILLTDAVWWGGMSIGRYKRFIGDPSAILRKGRRTLDKSFNFSSIWRKEQNGIVSYKIDGGSSNWNSYT